MKHILRDFMIFLIDVLGISFLYRVYSRTRGPLVRVVCFHDVADKEWFLGVVNMLVAEFNVITPEQFHNKILEKDKINILLTFDDGYESWVRNCLPVLEKYNLSALFFVNSGLLDAESNIEEAEKFMREHLKITPKAGLSWSGASQLLKSNQVLGGHTRTHRNMVNLNVDEMVEEVKGDKENIEKMLQIVLHDFAYPFGRNRNFTSDIVNTVFSSGYSYQYSAMPNFYTHTLQEPIPRTLLEKNQPLSSVRRWLQGGFDIFTNIIKVFI